MVILEFEITSFTGTSVMSEKTMKNAAIAHAARNYHSQLFAVPA
jgi:hypothetical protein